MSGLVLKLAPSERLLINGAVIENGQRRSRLNVLTPGVNILRLRDPIHPADARTPVRRLCYAAQLVLSGDRSMETVAPELMSGIDALAVALSDAASHRSLAEARIAVAAGNAYKALRALRCLLDLEARMLGQSS